MSGASDIIYQSASRRPLLTVERERSLALRAHAGDRQARNELVEANVRYVFHLARKFEHVTDLPFDDLLQEGTMGLIRAAELFDPRRGFRFTTYSHAWIVQAIQRGIYDRGKTIRVPVHQMERLRKLEREESRATANGEDLTIDDLSRSTGIAIDEIELIRKSQRMTVPFDKPIFEDGAETIADIIADQRGEAEFTALLTGLSDEIATARAVVDQRQWDVLDMRLGLSGAEPMTLQEVGDRLGVTRERVRQIEAQGLKKLRTSLVA